MKKQGKFLGKRAVCHFLVYLGLLIEPQKYGSKQKMKMGMNLNSC